MHYLALLLLTLPCLVSAESAPVSRGVILQYHHVSVTSPAATSITPDRFAEQLEYLAANHFTIWPLDRLVGAVRAGEATPDKVVAITFDDAYLSIYTAAFPMLAARGWPFTLFVATEPVERGNRQFLSWAQLAEMKAAGATIGNHSHSHTHLLRRLAGESDAAWQQRIHADIDTAEQLLQQHLGETAKLFAYPYGEYDAAVLQMLDAMGYIGFGQQSGALGPDSNPLIMPRFPMGGIYSDMASFKTKAAALPLPLVAEQPAVDPVVEDNYRPMLTLQLADAGLRLAQFACYGPGGSRTAIRRIAPLVFEVQSETDIPVGRSRYNCTVPSELSGRFYWYSRMWIRKRQDGSWYDEP